MHIISYVLMAVFRRRNWGCSASRAAAGEGGCMEAMVWRAVAMQTASKSSRRSATTSSTACKAEMFSLYAIMLFYKLYFFLNSLRAQHPFWMGDALF